MEEKINILKKLYLSKEVPIALDSFDWSLVEKSGIRNDRSWAFNNMKSYLSLGILFFIIFFFGVFALMPENSVMNTISGKGFNQDAKSIPSQIPQITPTGIDVIQKPSATPTITPTPTRVIPQPSISKNQKNIEQNTNSSNTSAGQEGNAESNDEDVKGASAEHRQDDKSSQSSNSNNSSNNSKKD